MDLKIDFNLTTSASTFLCFVELNTESEGFMSIT